MTEKPKRRAMTPARKLRIHTGQNGICGCGCGEPVDLSGPGVIYEHVIPWWFDPATLDDDGPNVQAWRKPCSKAKTDGKGGDLSRIAKTKRQGKMRLDVPREISGKLTSGRKLQSAPFPKKKAGKLPSRPLRGRSSFRR